MKHTKWTNTNEIQSKLEISLIFLKPSFQKTRLISRFDCNASKVYFVSLV